MKPHSQLCTMVLVIATVATQGAAGQEGSACGKFPPRAQYNPPDTSTEGCRCGAELDNVVITLKKPFRLQAVCNLRWAGADGNRAVNLSAAGVTFDSYTNGNLPYGELLLVGDAKIRGTVQYAPGPAGEFRFTPTNRSLAVRGPIAGLLGEFKLYREHAPSELRVPTSLRGAECWTADATLDVSDIWLLIGETDEAGAFPSRYKVLSIGGHRQCQ